MEIRTGATIFDETNRELGIRLRIQPICIDGVCSYLAAFLTRNDNKDTPFKETIGFKKIEALLHEYDFEEGQKGTENSGPGENYIFKRHENIPVITRGQSKEKFVLEDFAKDFKNII